MDISSVYEVPLEQVPWQQLQLLWDDCYPLPPRNVFERVLTGSFQRPRVWLASDGDFSLGVVMLSPHSKGGHLENLAVLPTARGRGIGQLLVQTLLQDVSYERPTMVTLTTRIPEFFSPLGFKSCGHLADGTTPMLILLPTLSISETPLHDHQNC
jgi:ribosomal protein S18 acetylase RimI-like enzyme